MNEIVISCVLLTENVGYYVVLEIVNISEKRLVLIYVVPDIRIP